MRSGTALQCQVSWKWRRHITLQIIRNVNPNLYIFSHTIIIICAINREQKNLLVNEKRRPFLLSGSFIFHTHHRHISSMIATSSVAHRI
jgi:hypothetical protein